MTDDWVYFVRCGPYVKIGVAGQGRLHDRLAELQVGNPEHLSLLGIMRGGHRVEHQLHRRWARNRRRGEWFLLTMDLAQFIVAACGDDAAPDLLKVARWYTDREFRDHHPSFIEIRTLVATVFRERFA